MRKSACIALLAALVLPVCASGSKDSAEDAELFIEDTSDIQKPGYGEGGGSGAANLPFDAPEITQDMLGDPTAPVPTAGSVQERPFDVLSGKVRVSGSDVYVATGLFSKVRLSFPKRSVDDALTVQVFIALKGTAVRVYGWYSDDRKSFVVFGKE